MLKKSQKHSTISVIEKLLDNAKIIYRTNMTFAQLTTIACGGGITLTIYPDSVQQLIYVWTQLHRHNIPTIVLGRGSNILATEHTFYGAVIVTTHCKDIVESSQGIWVDCGAMTVSLAKWLMSRNLGGGEFLYCLPATVGGAVTMNAGCYGQDMSSIVKAVTAVDKYGNQHTLDNLHCNFAYRHSVFKGNDNLLIIKVLIDCKDASYNVAQQCKQMFEQKRNSQPIDQKSFGSAFCLEGVAVSRLIDQAGLKGATVGGAMVSRKHAGFVVNANNAKSQDILLLLQHIQNTLRQIYGCQVTPEVLIIGQQWENNNDLGRLSYTHPLQ